MQPEHSAGINETTNSLHFQGAYPCAVQLLEACEALPEFCQVCCLQGDARVGLIRVPRQLCGNTLRVSMGTTLATGKQLRASSVPHDAG